MCNAMEAEDQTHICARKEKDPILRYSPDVQN